MTVRRRTTVAVSALVIFLATGVGTVAAQDSGRKEGNGKSWVTGGLGTGSQDLAAAASLDISWSDHIVSFRAAAVEPGLLFESGDRYNDVGLLYGHAVRWSDGIAALSGGIGVARGDLETRPSLPIAARAAWHFSPAFGIGTYWFLNINREDPFGGVTLTLELGMLR